MAAVELRITRQPSNLVRGLGDSAHFLVETVGPVQSYQWYKDGHPAPGLSTGQRYVVTNIGAAVAGLYRVVVKATGGAEVSSAEARLSVGRSGVTTAPTTSQVDPGGGSTPSDPPKLEQLLEWDPTFAPAALGGSVVAALAVAWPLWWALGRVIGSKDAPNLLAVTCLMFLLLGTAAAAAGVFVTMIELRGRSRLRKATDGSREVVSDLIAAAPNLLKEFGALRSAPALLAVALALYGGAGALAWHESGLPSVPPVTTTTSSTVPKVTTTTASDASSTPTSTETTIPIHNG